MAKNSRNTGGRSSTQLTIFDMVREHQAAQVNGPQPGTFNLSNQIRQELTNGLKRSPLSRHEVAAQMSDLVGVEITKSQLDSWTAESKDGHRFPAEYLPAFVRVTGHKRLLHIMAELVDCYVLESEVALLAELGHIKESKRELTKREQAIRAFLREMREVPSKGGC